jgi:molybdopterin-guanine dinucleotide biosynthesis protein A
VPQAGQGVRALAAVVLAGGASRRMGRDKATMSHPGPSGLTMVEHTVAVLAQRCSPVFVIAAPGQALPPLDAGINALILRDDVRGIGPLLATGRGLRAAAEAGLDRAFVSAVDMPYLSVEVIDQLAGHEGADIVLPWDGRDHYLAGIYRTGLADLVDDLVAMGERSMRALTGSVVTQRVVLPPTAAPSALTNLNEPADLP